MWLYHGEKITLFRRCGVLICLSNVAGDQSIRIGEYWHNTLLRSVKLLYHFRVSLRSELPTFNCCSHGTRSPLRFSRITLENCYCYQDQLMRHLRKLSRKCFSSVAPSSYLQPILKVLPECFSRSSESTLSSSVILFQGWSIWQVSCYTLLCRFRLQWPLSCCLYRSTPFMVTHELNLDA